MALAKLCVQPSTDLHSSFVTPNFGIEYVSNFYSVIVNNSNSKVTNVNKLDRFGKNPIRETVSIQLLFVKLLVNVCLFGRHWEEQITSDNSTNHGNQPDLKSQKLLQNVPLNKTKPHPLTYIVDEILNTPTYFFLDNSSTACVVSAEVLELLNISFKNYNGTITAVGGDSLTVIGKVLLPLTFEGSTVATQFQVLQQCAVPILLGIDFIQLVDASINYPQQTLNFAINNNTISLQLYLKKQPKNNQTNFIIKTPAQMEGLDIVTIYDEVQLFYSNNTFSLQHTIAALAKKVNELLVRQDSNTIEENTDADQYVLTRSLAKDLQTYPRLIEAAPSIDTDFFRPPLSEEEKRDIVQTCPQTMGMMYTQPPINDAATVPIKKLDNAYYNVQLFITQATRPVDYYVHQLLQDEPEAPADDPRFLFASTMRLLLSEACTLLTQARLDNLHLGRSLLGSPSQLDPSYGNPLMEPTALSELLAAKKTDKSSNSKLFCGRQQQAALQKTSQTITASATAPTTNQAYTTDGSSQQFPNSTGGFQSGSGESRGRKRGPPVEGCLHKYKEAWENNCQRVLSAVEQTSTADPTSQVKHGAQSSQSHDVGNCRAIVQKNNRKSIPAVTGILLKHICCPKENWRTLPCPRLEAVEQTPKEYSLQNRVTGVYYQDDPKKGLSNIN
ncbi:hypothetical protein BB561_001697 [Smittium simulii]|uniref:Aspartic peptidase DDI1-type domain-containing protein n=1 Tax=Smittium simulii TaxID=133385 RepID=A0A2T9YTG2_9FUNG|nr:hypothetical protein BB561_001697 [Smittium simulii]